MSQGKLYIVTRDDLSAAYQAVQVAHALADAILKYPKEALSWHRQSNTLVVLSVQNEFGLMALEDQLTEANMKFVSFKEPDIADELTAISIMPDENIKKICSNMKLALKNYAPITQGRVESSKDFNLGSSPSGCANPEVV